MNTETTPLARNDTVAKQAKVPQQPGCLPEGYGENSLLTLPQFARWKQISLKTAIKRFSITPGRVQHSIRDRRVHVGTHLAGVVKK
jgi:hypothetical protein